MLDLKNIESYYSEPFRVHKRNILREYLQHKILEVIFESDLSNKISLIGGTSIRIVHNLNRFSEDLDFDNFSLQKEEFIKLSHTIKKKLELEGYVIEVKSVFRGVFRTYVRFLDLLYGTGLSPYKQEKLMIQVDTEPHDYVYDPQPFILNKFDVFTRLNVTPVHILLSMKIAAFLYRKRVKARDIYDIIFLWGKTEPDFDYLKEKFNITNKRKLKTVLMKKAQGLNYKVLASELVPFLIKDRDTIKIQMFDEFLQSL